MTWVMECECSLILRLPAIEAVSFRNRKLQEAALKLMPHRVAADSEHSRNETEGAYGECGHGKAGSERL